MVSLLFRCKSCDQVRNTYNYEELGQQIPSLWKEAEEKQCLVYAMCFTSVFSPRTRPELLANPETPFWQHALAEPPQWDNGVRHVWMLLQYLLGVPCLVALQVRLSSHLYLRMWACKWGKSMRFSWPESQPPSSAVSPTWGHPVSPLLRHSTPPNLSKAAKVSTKCEIGKLEDRNWRFLNVSSKLQFCCNFSFWALTWFLTGQWHRWWVFIAVANSK